VDIAYATEEWRPVEGWPYEVSSLGRVRRTVTRTSAKAGHVLAWSLRKGYPGCTLHRPGATRPTTVAALVCEVFHGSRPTPAHQVRHLDGDKLNSRPDNLCWGTGKENEEDKRRHGRKPAGERVYNAKLTNAQVAELRAAWVQVRAGRKQAPKGWGARMAAAYGVHQYCLAGILSGRGYQEA
jgi:hypothetical protein